MPYESNTDVERFQQLQVRLWEWQDKNFGCTGPQAPPRHPFLGMCEEAGELVHSTLKLSQGIRGTKEEHIANMKDAIGDIMVYLINFCHRGGLGFLESKPSFYSIPLTHVQCSAVPLEMLAWTVYKQVARFGLYFEPLFIQDTALPSSIHTSLHECAMLICDDLAYMANVLGTTLFACVDYVWVHVLSKRDWKVDPVNGVGV